MHEMVTNLSKASIPPSSLLNKFFYYKHKYGLLHTICSYIGRYSFSFWRLVGPLVTYKSLKRWQESSDFHILNLGGGSHCIDGCLTVDIDPRADVYVDITRRLPFPDASIDGIFCEEVIEHIDLEQGLELLKECCRVLRPGGVLRLTTPDLNWFLKRTIETPNDCNEINSIFHEHGHRFLYTRESLSFYCREVGFINSRVSSYQDCKSSLGYLDSHAHRFNYSASISQYLEVQKPCT